MSMLLRSPAGHPRSTRGRRLKMMDGSEPWEDPGKGQGRRGDEKDVVLRLSGAVACQRTLGAAVAADWLVKRGWVAFRKDGRMGL